MDMAMGCIDRNMDGDLVLYLRQKKKGIYSMVNPSLSPLLIYNKL